MCCFHTCTAHLAAQPSAAAGSFHAFCCGEAIKIIYEVFIILHFLHIICYYDDGISVTEHSSSRGGKSTRGGGGLLERKGEVGKEADREEDRANTGSAAQSPREQRRSCSTTVLCIIRLGAIALMTKAHPLRAAS